MSQNRNRSIIASQVPLRSATSGVDVDENAIEGAAVALREVEVEAAQPAAASAAEPTAGDLDAMSIDELRKLAAHLEVPNRAQIIDRDELAAAIRARL